MEQHQQQLQQAPSNLVLTPHLIWTRSDSSSTVILDSEMIHTESTHLPTSLLVNGSVALRSLLKTSGLFNEDMESSDKLNELFPNGTEFTLHRLLSDIGVNDMNIDMNDLVKFDPMKLLDARSFSEFLTCDSFEGLNVTADFPTEQQDSVPPSAIACSSGSFSELCPATMELTNKDFHIDANQMKLEPDSALVYTELNPFNNAVFTPTTSAPIVHEFNFDPSALAAFEHDDFGYLSKPSIIVDTPSPSPTISKRTATRRTSSRLQTRAALFDIKQMLEDDSCSSALASPTSSISSKRAKRSRHVNRAVDIKTEDDLSYYLERRRKNNEASKMSRAARKQKFGDMDSRCAEYERANAELRLKISTLEIVTANLKDGLIHTFQRKGGVNAKL